MFCHTKRSGLRNWCSLYTLGRDGFYAYANDMGVQHVLASMDGLEYGLGNGMGYGYEMGLGNGLGYEYAYDANGHGHGNGYGNGHGFWYGHGHGYAHGLGNGHAGRMGHVGATDAQTAGAQASTRRLWK